MQGGHCRITGGSLPHYRGGTATLQGDHCHITGGHCCITGGGTATLQGGVTATLQGDHCHITGGSLVPSFRLNVTHFMLDTLGGVTDSESVSMNGSG